MQVTPVYLTVQHVAAMLGISKATVWRWASEGHLPVPVKLGPNTTRWRLSDLENFLAEPEGRLEPIVF